MLVTHPASRILRQLLDFWKICGPLTANSYFHARRYSSGYPLASRLGGPQSRSARCEDVKNFHPCWESNSCHPAPSHSLQTTEGYPSSNRKFVNATHPHFVRQISCTFQIINVKTAWTPYCSQISRTVKHLLSEISYKNTLTRQWHWGLIQSTARDGGVLYL